MKILAFFVSRLGGLVLFIILCFSTVQSINFYTSGVVNKNTNLENFMILVQKEEGVIEEVSLTYLPKYLAKNKNTTLQLNG